MTIDMDALRRETHGEPTDTVLVTRRYLAALVARIEAKGSLDLPMPPMPAPSR